MNYGSLQNGKEIVLSLKVMTQIKSKLYLKV